MRTSSQKINKNLENQIKSMLSQSVVDIKNASDAEQFLKGILTDTEYETVAKRLAVAYWLKKGRSYQNIKTNLKVSSATIASVQTILEKPGITWALKNIEAEEWANQWSQKIKKFLPAF